MLKVRTVLFLLLTISALRGYEASAATVVVGPTACRPTLPHFSPFKQP